MEDAILLDSNILIYAFLQNPNITQQQQFHLKSKAILENQSNLYVNYNCYLEFKRVMTSKPVLKFIDLNFVEESVSYLDENISIIYPTETTNSILNDLLKTYTPHSGQIFDLLIVAQAIEHDITSIYTKNAKDFPTDEGIEIIDPTL